MIVNQDSSDTTIFTVNSGKLTIDDLSGGGFGSYTKEGAGELVIDKTAAAGQGINLTINGGTVSLKPGNAQANGFIFGLNIFNGSTFNMNGASARTNSVSSNGVPGALNLGAGGVLNLGIYGGASYFGSINDAGSLIVGAVAANDPSAIGIPQTVTLGGNNTYSGTTTVTNGSTLIATHENALGTGPLVLDTGTRVNLAAGLATAMKHSAVTIDGGTTPTATIDLANNALVVDYNSPTPTPFATIQAQIKSAYNTSVTSGHWQGLGITSSMANDGQFAVGYAERCGTNDRSGDLRHGRC